MSNSRIREFRISKNLTQRQLAQRTGLSIGMISQIEAGKKRLTQPSFDKIIKVFKITQDEFFSTYSLEDGKMCARILKICHGTRPALKNFLATTLRGLEILNDYSPETPSEAHTAKILKSMNKVLMQRLDILETQIKTGQAKLLKSKNKK